MSNESSNQKRFRSAAILFLISGLIFFIVGIVSIAGNHAATFLPVGIAMAIIGFVFLQYSRGVGIDNRDNSSE